MAISIHLASKICETLGNWCVGKRVLTLGALDPYFSESDLATVMGEAGLPATQPTTPNRLSKVSRWRDQKFISATAFFQTLGFQEVVSIDYSAYENADILFDLNQTSPPESTLEAFDLIIDAGTLEHVFHVPNALSNLGRMLKVGGRILHHVPCSNLIDHGLYQFSPTFFVDYYSKNHYRTLAAYVHRISLTGHAPTNEFLPYTRSLFAQTCHTGTPGEFCYLNLFLFEKTTLSTAGVVPQQSGYEEFAWKTPNWEKHEGDQQIRAISGRLRESVRLIQSVLHENPGHKIFLYGAGTHTRILLKVWKEFLETPVSGIVETQKSARDFEGIPIVAVDELNGYTNTLLILSSLAFEREMVREIETRKIGVKYLGLYDHTLTRV